MKLPNESAPHTPHGGPVLDTVIFEQPVSIPDDPMLDKCQCGHVKGMHWHRAGRVVEECGWLGSATCADPCKCKKFASTPAAPPDDVVFTHPAYWSDSSLYPDNLITSAPASEVCPANSGKPHQWDGVECMYCERKQTIPAAPPVEPTDNSMDAVNELWLELSPDTTCSHCGRDMNRRPQENCSHGGMCVSITEISQTADVVIDAKNVPYWLVELDSLTFRFTKGGTQIITCGLNDPLAIKEKTREDAEKWSATLLDRSPWMKDRIKIVEHITIQPVSADHPNCNMWSAAKEKDHSYSGGIDGLSGAKVTLPDSSSPSPIAAHKPIRPDVDASKAEILAYINALDAPIAGAKQINQELLDALRECLDLFGTNLIEQQEYANYCTGSCDAKFIRHAHAAIAHADEWRRTK